MTCQYFFVHRHTRRVPDDYSALDFEAHYFNCPYCVNWVFEFKKQAKVEQYEGLDLWESRNQKPKDKGESEIENIQESIGLRRKGYDTN